MRWLVGLVLMIIGLLWYWMRPVSYPQVYVKQPPRQLAMEIPVERQIGRWKLTGFASYEFKALVLSAKRYPYDPGADLAPVDLAIGWQAMSDRNELKGFKMWQSGRFYTYQWEDGASVLPQDKVNSQSANTHTIPANPAVEKALLKVRAGDVIEAKGMLVDAQSSDGGTWRSSRRRDDSGGGACELFLVEELRILSPSDPDYPR